MCVITSSPSVGSIAFAAKPTIRLYHAVQDRRTRHRIEEELSEEAFEQLRRLRNIAVAISQHALDVLPLDAG